MNGAAMKWMMAVGVALGFIWAGMGTASAQVARPMWRTELPGGNYSVALASISSVSTHEYIVDKAVRVFELTIGTNGSVEARFYYVEPIKAAAPGGIGQSIIDKAQEKVQEGATRIAGDNAALLSTVMKDYPTTTHAHTVEYRLATRDDVTKMFKSAETAWRQNTDTMFKP